MALSPEQMFRITKLVLITFTTLTIIATFVGYGVVVHVINQNMDASASDADKKYWKAWRAVSITYLVIEDVVALAGLFGAIKEHYCLTLSYGIAMTVLWFFNFSNRALARNNVFNYLVAIGVIFSAFYFALKIRRRQYPCSSIGQPQVVVSPAPAVIQVQPSYIPNQSVYTVQTGPSPPPPYSTASQPQLAFKY